MSEDTNGKKSITGRALGLLSKAANAAAKATAAAAEKIQDIDEEDVYAAKDKAVSLANSAYQKVKSIDREDVRGAVDKAVTIAGSTYEKVKSIDREDVIEAKTKAVSAASDVYEKAKNISAQDVRDAAVSTVDKVKNFDPEDIKFSTQDVFEKVLKINTNIIDREEFLAGHPELSTADSKTVSEIAENNINSEVTKASGISVVAGSMWATIPADVVQYFGFVLRLAQKLAYLYGYPEFNIADGVADEAAIDHLMILIGIMYDVPEAKEILGTMLDEASDSTDVSPAVKAASEAVSKKMTSLTVAKGVGAAIPVAGQVLAGTLTYKTLKPAAERLKTALEAYRGADDAANLTDTQTD